MTTNRRFCRFNSGRSISLGRVDNVPFGMKEVPEGGLCLSSFLVITKENDHDGVLMGRLNPDSPWDHIGALDESRTQVHSKGWMLPSSHLIVHESPQDAASRILKEQLEIDNLELSEPKVVSEVYTPKRFQDLPAHWDIEFIFLGKLGELPPRPKAWTEIRFVNLKNTNRSDVARSHEDILESAGFRIKS